MKEIFGTAVWRSFSCTRLRNCLAVLSSLALSKISGKIFLAGLPIVLNIEPTARCNLNCPQCLTGLGKISRAESFIDLKLFKQILDELGDKIWYLLLYNQGEPFLHPQLIELIKLAKSKRIYVTTSSNGHFLPAESHVEQLIRSGLDSIFISLDGADSETYLQYRVGGNFDRVIAGIKLLKQVRQRLQYKTPKIVIQFIVMRHNEHQLTQMKKLAWSLGADRLLFKTVHLEDSTRATEFLPQCAKWQRYRTHASGIALANSTSGCNRLWYSSVILCDGRVVPCCFDKNGKYSFGKLTKTTTFKQIWFSYEYRQFRNTVAAGKNNIDLCRNCTQNQKVFI